MEQDIKIFEHEKFGKVRVIIINDEPWFVAVDVCKALELKNPRDAISRLDKKEKQTIIITDGVSKDGVTNTVGTSDGINDATFGWIENRVNIVNEPGFYKLVFSSRKKEALEFQDWVYREVLPSIRKYGYYALVPPVNAPVVAANPVQPVHVPNPNRRAGQFKDACVYVAFMSDNTVKIGQSYNVERRLNQIAQKYNLKVKNSYETSLMSRKNARWIESSCHKIFSSFRLNGEFFSINFETAREAVKILEKTRL